MLASFPKLNIEFETLLGHAPLSASSQPCELNHQIGFRSWQSRSSNLKAFVSCSPRSGGPCLIRRTRWSHISAHSHVRVGPTMNQFESRRLAFFASAGKACLERRSFCQKANERTSKLQWHKGYDDERFGASNSGERFLRPRRFVFAMVTLAKPFIVAVPLLLSPVYSGTR